MTGSARGPMRDFQFEGGGERRKITDVVPCDIDMVRYYDEEGKQQVRIVATTKSGGKDVGVVAQHQIQGTQVFTPMAQWFYSALAEKKAGKSGAESI